MMKALNVRETLKRSLPEKLHSRSFYVPSGIRLGGIEAPMNAEVDGVVDGPIMLDGQRLTISPNGKVHGDVEARIVIVRGLLVGNVTASESVELAAGAAIEGNVSTPTLVLADGGCSFRGSLNRDEGATTARIVRETDASRHPVNPRSEGDPPASEGNLVNPSN
jgi:cytoskeletal protein CcmA (bactofilin family)